MDTVGAAGAHAVGIIGICPGGGAIGHRCQLPATLPRISPGAVTKRVADLVIADGRTIITGQQVAPGIVAVGVHHGVQHFAQLAGGVGILLTLQNIACIIISPDPGLAGKRIVFTDQLVAEL